MIKNKEDVWKAIALSVLDTKEMQSVLDRINRLENLLIDLAGEDNELLSKGDIKRALLKEGVIHK